MKFQKVIHNKILHVSMPKKRMGRSIWTGNRKKYSKIKGIRKGGKGESSVTVG